MLCQCAMAMARPEVCVAVATSQGASTGLRCTNHVLPPSLVCPLVWQELMLEVASRIAPQPTTVRSSSNMCWTFDHIL